MKLRDKRKKCMSVILTFMLCVVLLVQPVFAQTKQEMVYSQTETFSDGSYIVDEIRVSSRADSSISPMAAMKSKSATRTYTAYNSFGEKRWSFSLTGSFQYDGSTSKATGATSSYTIYKSDWKCSSRTATYSGNTAKGTATFKYLTTTSNVEIGLKCSASGKISNVDY